jgi:hypothetical protein
MDGQQIERNSETHSFTTPCSATGSLLPRVWTSDPRRLGQRIVLKHFTKTSNQEAHQPRKGYFLAASHWKTKNSHNKN